MELLALAADWSLFAGLAAASGSGFLAFFKEDSKEATLDKMSALHKIYHDHH
jgi:hypothetical protein